MEVESSAVLDLISSNQFIFNCVILEGLCPAPFSPVSLFLGLLCQPHERPRKVC